MATIWSDAHTFLKPVVFSGEVTFSETPPEISLDNLASLSGTGTCTFADLVATDDVTVGDDLIVTDDASVGGDLAVTGAATIGGNLTGAATVQGADLVATDDLTVGDDAAVGGDLAVTGDVNVTGEVNAPNAVARFVGPLITEAALAGGTTTKVVALGGEEYPWNALGAIIPVALYVELEEPLNGTVGTTSLTCTIGTAADPDAYMTTSEDMIATDFYGPVQAGGGVGLNGLQKATDVRLTFTAGGGVPLVTDVTNLKLRVVVYYRALYPI